MTIFTKYECEADMIAANDGALLRLCQLRGIDGWRLCFSKLGRAPGASAEVYYCIFERGQPSTTP